jgi:disulfide bond formation protein DsbB
MVMWDEVVILIFSILTLIGSVLLFVYVLDIIMGKIRGKMFFHGFWKFFGNRAIFFVFIISLLATGGSLIFSEILKFEPCKFCWFQRILMYPQLFLTAIALIRKEKKILPYLLVLSVLGVLIAGFHYYGQTNENTSLPCSSIGYSASCSDYFFLQFGFITIPMMAFIAFLLIIALCHAIHNL